ncbi:hypothetical protein PBT90_17405 [Algoriphagus halophytocola]|uniref:PH domain-containing protein n=1 Tax=Algoriphagus halophytocola TaxID=2991499 RepID=A0ABY6MCA7_9BACT|nr:MULTISPECIES: hypothetical protein [unclassified Algoriphagus]UZD21302.1 hypothetical protein OM944_11540 [Algoriphagus sp. TR-M5]WBL42513.1 hypothetical protein PBT90_17405 [Algoriphagus sp. TR-M9]
MKKSKEKVMVRLKRNFPFIELSLMGFYGFIIVISIYKLFIRHEMEFVWILIGVILALLAFGIFFSNSNKILTVTDERLHIKKWLSGQRFDFYLKDIKGFDLKENYDRFGLVKHVRIITKDNEIFEFIKMNYSNYDKLIPGLQRAGLPFLGSVELKSKYKHIYALIGAISSALAVLGFFLVQLMKVIK